jgi:predicted O-methyltransferase YrrM
MTVSLDLCLFLLSLCEFHRPKRILDLGSGFSSFLFRFYAAGADPVPEIWSVDDSAEWLEKTRSYLTRHELPDANLLTWDNLITRDAGRFDLVLYDLGGFDFRKNSFSRVLEYVGDHAFLVVDDMHAAEFGRHVIRLLGKTGFPYFSARTYTNDKYGRYSLLAQCGEREGRG